MAVPWLFDPHYFHRSSAGRQDDGMVFLFFWLFLIGQIVMAVVAGYVIGALGGLPRPLWSWTNCIRVLAGYGAGFTVYVGVPAFGWLLCKLFSRLRRVSDDEDDR